MYKVVQFYDDASCVRIKFRSHVERQCWEFVKGQSRNNIKELIVMNKIDEFMPVPEDVQSLQTYYSLFNERKF